MIRIITIEREYGSGGADIAQKVAQRLNWKLWDQLLTNEIARLMECDCSVVQKHEEKKDPMYYRLLKGFMHGSYEGSVHAPNPNFADTDCIRQVCERVVTSAAQAGQCVIVGRGSAYYLQTRPDAFHVFIYAPLQEKIRRLRAQGKSEKEAAQLAESVDRDRAAFIKQYFGVDWPDRQRFHLMLNSTIGEDTATDTILNSIATLHKPTTASAAPIHQAAN
jgi:cytidylate kinase